MADKRISQLIERTDIANNDVLPIVASGATTTNKVTVSTLQEWMQDNLDVGVTSVGLSMPSAFVVSASPVTTSGNIAVTGAGTVSQYIRGDGSLADFPQSSGGGGASVSYYLNGSVSQGTIGGVAYLEMSKTPVLGAGTNFTINANGYIASFITDAGDPNLLLIPGGNWNFETYFAASSGGGTPSFYVELYKVSGSTATLVASNSANPELIAFGTTTTAYFSSLAVPATTLTLTDRLALRYYVTHAGRTITLHTENSNLCQIITTFTTGLTALNGLTAQVQNFATGTSGTDFNISSSSATHTFNLPDASASNRGAVTTGSQIFGGVKTFANGLSLSAVGGSNQVTRIVNIGTLHEGSATLNQIGFNSGNNIYFGKGLSNGGVISWNNAAVRYYTLPDADGTIALTSDFGNYIQGVGTADSIPKFTGARTIANSAIRDTTSTVVISKNVSVDNGASQAINLTPASGGTTNRIETTGTLPLAIITSGSSITLAAGGVTPQITLASTGAVTLTGALNGTSASFTGNAQADFFTVGTTAATSGGVRLGTQVAIRARNVANTANIPLIESTASDGVSVSNGALILASTGAATFSGALTTSGDFFISGASKSIVFNSGTNLNTQIYETSGSLVLYTGGNPRLTIASTGAATFSSSVTATANASGRSGLFGGSSFGLRIDNAGSFNNGGTTLHGVDNTFVASYQKLSLNGSSLEFMTDYNPRVTITNGGNVGIGTASPDSQLTLNGSSNSRLNMRAGDTRYGTLYADNGVFAVSSITAIPLVLGTNDTERMRITSQGYLKASNTGSYQGVSDRYHELRTNLSDEWTAIIGNSSSSPYGIQLRYAGASPNGTANQFLVCSDSTVDRLRIASNGNVTNTNGSYGAISDAKLKENIEDASPKLDDLMKVKVRNYNLIGDDKKQIGVIAQELEEVFPAMIDESEDFEEVEVPQVDEEGNEILNEEGEVQTSKQRVSKGTTTKSVKYSVFVPMLIKAMQEQQEQIKSLTEQVEALKSQING